MIEHRGIMLIVSVEKSLYRHKKAGRSRLGSCPRSDRFASKTFSPKSEVIRAFFGCPARRLCQVCYHFFSRLWEERGFCLAEDRKV